MEDLGEKFRLIRIHHGLTQKELGDLMGKLAISVRRMEKGQVKIQLEDIEKIASVLKINFLDVITWPEKYIPAKQGYLAESQLNLVNESQSNYNCKNCESLRMVIDVQNDHIKTLKNDLANYQSEYRKTGSG